jgi:hypothetical protein
VNFRFSSSRSSSLPPQHNKKSTHCALISPPIFRISFQAVCDGKSFLCNSKKKQTLFCASHLAKRKFTFFLRLLFFLLAFQLTKIVILLRNHIYMCFVAAERSSQALGVLCMADFEQFIYFILRCACFSRVFSSTHRPTTPPSSSLV